MAAGVGAGGGAAAAILSVFFLLLCCWFGKVRKLGFKNLQLYKLSLGLAVETGGKKFRGD